MRTEPVTVSMASHPLRQQGMLARVRELLPQVQGTKDTLRLYLNNYDATIFDLLPKDPHLEVFLAGVNRQVPNRGSQGKFWHVGLNADGVSTEGYWLTCDDDIHYPEGYVDYMVEGCKKYNDRAIITMHGGTFGDLENGCLPNVPARQVRTLVEYWRQRDNDHQMHTAGCGTTCFRPSIIHMDDSVMTGSLHSGDDEDLAVWAQQNAVPIIRLAGRHAWVTADDAVHTIEPMYSNAMALAMADAKVKAWRKWGYPPLYTPPSKPPAQGTHGMFDRAMTKDELAYCSKVLSSDALATMIVHRVLMGIPTSLIRMSDGERSLIECTKGNPVIPEQQDERWLARYGLLGADLKKVGEKLLEAGRTADYLACSISGVYLPQYRTWEYFPEREVFVDQFFATLWEATDRVGAVLSSAPKGVVVLHREAPQIAARLIARYGIKATGVVLNSWKDHERILNTTTAQKEQIFLVSGGPAGKWLCVQLAKISGSVVLDIGESMGIWAK